MNLSYLYPNMPNMWFEKFRLAMAAVLIQCLSWAIVWRVMVGSRWNNAAQILNNTDIRTDWNGVNSLFSVSRRHFFFIQPRTTMVMFSPLPCDGDRSDGLSLELSRVPSRVPAPDGQFHGFGFLQKLCTTGWFTCDVVDWLCCYSWASRNQVQL